MVDTAGGKVKIERRGLLFAVIEDGEGNSAIIRAQALLVPGLQSENLVPVNVLSSCDTCKVSFGRSSLPGDCRTVAEATLEGIRGERFVLRWPESQGLYNITLKPLAEDDVRAWRHVFDDATMGQGPQFAQLEGKAPLATNFEHLPSARRKSAAAAIDESGRTRLINVPPSHEHVHRGCKDCTLTPQKALATTRSRARLEAEGIAPAPGGANIDSEDIEPTSLSDLSGGSAITPLSLHSQDGRPAADETTGTLNKDYSEELHRKLGHVSYDRLIEAIDGGLVRLERAPTKAQLKDARDAIRQCPGCRQGDPTKARANKRKKARDLKPFDVMHMDVHYLPDTPSHERPLDAYTGHHPPPLGCERGYILTAVDEATRYELVEHIENKETVTVATAFLRMEERARRIMTESIEMNPEFAKSKGYSWDKVRNHSVSVIKHIHSDLGSEFTGHGMTYSHATPLPEEWEGEEAFALAMSRFAPYLVTVGRFEEGGAPITSFGRTNERKYENGLNENHHRTAERMTLAELNTAGMGTTSFYYAYAHAVEIKNILPTTVPIPGTTDVRRSSPFTEVLGFAYEERKRRLPVFGSLAYPLARGESKHQQPRRVGLFLGNEPYPSRDYRVSKRVIDNHRNRWEVATEGPETTFSSTYATRHGPKVLATILESQYPPTDNPDVITAYDTGNEPPEAILTDDPEDAGDEPDQPEAPGNLYIPQVAFQECSDSDVDSDDDSDGPPSLVDSDEDSDDDSDGPPSLVDSDDEDSDPTSFITAEEPPDIDDASSVYAAMSVTLATEGRILPFLPAQLCPKRWPIATPRPRACNHCAMSIRPSDGSIRKEIHEISDEEWDAARLKEYEGLLEKQVVEPAKLPPGARKLGVKEVLKVRGDNSPKVRLVAQGFRQLPNTDYFETYSPVASISTIRMVVAIAASFGLTLKTADVKQAYLQAEMKEELYIEIPDALRQQEGFQDANCLRLRKGLYGTKQAGRGWYEKLKKAILDTFMFEAPEDPCLYFRFSENGQLNLLLCTLVDDILGAGDDGAFDDFLDRLRAQGIELDDESIGDAREFNGMRITRISKHHYELDQETYLQELGRSYSQMYSWRPKQGVTSPLGPTLDKGLRNVQEIAQLADKDMSTLSREERADVELYRDPGKRKEFNARYQSLLGSEMWPAMITRPDIAFAVSAAGEHANEPWTRHLAALERTLSYLLNTSGKRLVYDFTDSSRQIDMAVFTDSDFASDESDRKSRTGVWLGVNGSPIYWSSKKQTVVADSTTAAETIAAHAGMRQVRALAGNLRAMGFNVDYTPLFCDNTATLKRIVNDKSSDAMGAKNLAVITKMLQEATSQEHKDIWPFHVASEENLADIFTKGHLSGANALLSWAASEARARGETKSSVWIAEPMNANRSSFDHMGLLASARARIHIITDLDEFEELTSRGEV